MKIVAILMIRVYQVIKPFFDLVNLSVFGFSSACKHSPSCSQYAINQIQKHGTITGVKKGITRILACH